MRFSLRPAVFQKLVKIGTLFTEGKKPEQYYKSKMLKRLKKSKYHGPVRLVGIRLQAGTAAIVSPRSLHFWPENQAENEQIFDLSGCELAGGINSSGLNMVLVNSSKRRFEVCFSNHNQT